MTNIGLRITLPLSYDFRPTSRNWLSKFVTTPPKKPKVPKAILRCHKEGDFFHLVAIPLLHLGLNQFIRHPEETLSFLPIKTLPEFIEQEIFIKNLPSDNDISNEHLCAFIFSELHPAIEIIEVYPSNFWNPADKILQGSLQDDEWNSWHACLLLDVKLEERVKMLLFLGVNFQTWDDGFTGFEPWCELKSHEQNTLEHEHKEIKLPMNFRLRDASQKVLVPLLLLSHSIPRGVGGSISVNIIDPLKVSNYILDKSMRIVDITIDKKP